MFELDNHRERGKNYSLTNCLDRNPVARGRLGDGIFKDTETIINILGIYWQSNIQIGFFGWFLSSSVHLHIWKSAKRQSQTQTARVVNDGHLRTIFLKDMSRDIRMNSISSGQISTCLSHRMIYFRRSRGGKVTEKPIIVFHLTSHELVINK